MSANSTVLKPKLSRTSSAWAIACQPANAGPHHFPTAARKQHVSPADAPQVLQRMCDRLPAGECRAPPLPDSRERCAKDERHHEQERNAEDHAEGKQPRAHEVPPALACLARRSAPDAI